MEVDFEAWISFHVYLPNIMQANGHQKEGENLSNCEKTHLRAFLRPKYWFRSKKQKKIYVGALEPIFWIKMTKKNPRILAKFRIFKSDFELIT